MDELDEIVSEIRKRLSDSEKRTDQEVLTELNPPATAEEVQTAEEIVGFELPPVLKRLYLEVANGGFGPGYGLAGVAGRGLCQSDKDLVALCQEQSSSEWKARFPEWPLHIVRICYLGCEMFVAVDIATADYGMFLFDAVLEGVEIEGEVDLYFRNCLTPYDVSLNEWLYLWAQGIDVQLPPEINPDSYTGISWDVIINDLPKEIETSSPRAARDYVPKPIGTRTEIIKKILEIVPFAIFPNLRDGVIKGPDFSIEISLGEDEELDCLAFYVQGDETAAGIIADIIRHLNLSAFEATNGDYFYPEDAKEKYRKWRANHDDASKW